MRQTLREILKDRGIPQSVVADALGISQPNIVRYDDLRKRSIYELEKISESTGITISDLIGVEVNYKKQSNDIENSEIDFLRKRNIELERRVGFLEGQNSLLREQVGMSKPAENVKGKSA